MPPRKSENLAGTLARATKDEVDIDFSGARESGDFTPLPPSDYEAVVHSCEPGVSGSGNPKLVFQFKVTDARAAGRILFKHVPVKGEGSGIARDVLNALGFDTSNMKKFKPGDALDRPCLITVAIQANNPDFNEVKRVKPAQKRSAVGGTAKAAPKAAATKTSSATAGRATRSSRLAK